MRASSGETVVDERGGGDVHADLELDARWRAQSPAQPLPRSARARARSRRRGSSGNPGASWASISSARSSGDTPRSDAIVRSPAASTSETTTPGPSVDDRAAQLDSVALDLGRGESPSGVRGPLADVAAAAAECQAHAATFAACPPAPTRVSAGTSSPASKRLSEPHDHVEQQIAERADARPRLRAGHSRIVAWTATVRGRARSFPPRRPGRPRRARRGAPPSPAAGVEGDLRACGVRAGSCFREMIERESHDGSARAAPRRAGP